MKINQLNIKSTRPLSIMDNNVGFTLTVWVKIINNLQGFTYTQKEFLKLILSKIILRESIHVETQSKIAWLNASTIYQHTLQYFISLKDCFHFAYGQDIDRNLRGMARFLDINPDMIWKPGKGYRVQKIIRLLLKPILTEREIRKETSYWTEKFPEKYYDIGTLKPFMDYMMIKSTIFMLRLAQRVEKNTEQYIRVPELKSFGKSRMPQDKQFTTLTKGILHTFVPDTPSASLVYRDYIHGYDRYMDKYLHLSSMPATSNRNYIGTKLISNSLLEDIQKTISKSDNFIPKAIKSNPKKFKQHRLISNILYSYTYCLQSMPSIQTEDRHFTINSTGQMSYTPANKPTYLNNNKQKWLAGAERSITKYGKGVRKIFESFPQTIPDYLIEIICNRLKSKHQFTGVINVVEGEDIRHWYNERNHNRDYQLSSLSSSCMRHQGCQPYMDLYVQNPSVCQMMIITEKDNNNVDKLVARALLWTTNCETKIMDRIYGNDKYIQVAKQWASNNGYLYKTRQSYDEPRGFINAIGECICQDYDIDVKYPNGSRLPYLDTFSQAHSPVIDGEQLTFTLSNYSTSHSASMTSTSGSICRMFQDHNERIGTSNSSTPRDGTINPDDDDLVWFDGEWMNRDEVGFCEYNQQYYHTDYLCWSDHDDCWYYENDVYQVDGCDDWFCSHHTYDDHHTWSDHEDRYLLNNESISVYDRDGDCVDYVHETSDDVTYCEGNCYYMFNDSTEECQHVGLWYSLELMQSVTIQSTDETFYVHADNVDEFIEERGLEDETLTINDM